jgi:hypothetical protein
MAGEISPLRQQEYIHKKNMLVKFSHLFEKFATLSNCGKLLRAFTTTLIWKHLRGTRLIAVPNGKNVKDWTIRIQESYKCKIKVQRLNGNGLNSLRYSLVSI